MLSDRERQQHAIWMAFKTLGDPLHASKSAELACLFGEHCNVKCDAKRVRRRLLAIYGCQDTREEEKVAQEPPQSQTAPFYVRPLGTFASAGPLAGHPATYQVRWGPVPYCTCPNEEFAENIVKLLTADASSDKTEPPKGETGRFRAMLANNYRWWELYDRKSKKRLARGMERELAVKMAALLNEEPDPPKRETGRFKAEVLVEHGCTWAKLVDDGETLVNQMPTDAAVRVAKLLNELHEQRAAQPDPPQRFKGPFRVYTVRKEFGQGPVAEWFVQDTNSRVVASWDRTEWGESCQDQAELVRDALNAREEAK